MLFIFFTGGGGGGGLGEMNLLFSLFLDTLSRDSVTSHSYMGELRVACATSDVTRDDSHRRFLAQQSAAML